MKKILITGKGSYIGESFKKWIENEDVIVEELEMQGDKWKAEDFSQYDTILHVAGIAHVSSDPKLEDLYYKVNRDLAVETAKKAKEDGARQFIFMSSMIVYGKDEPVGTDKIITEETEMKAENFYGNSKLEADLEIQKLSDEKFKVVIVRTPMVYGANCKGNFPRLRKLAKMTFIFPSIENRRSMIYIDNLCEFFKQVVLEEKVGIFFPQNKEYVSTKEIINQMAKQFNRKIWFISVFNWVIKVLAKKIGFINKIFGSKVYSKDISGDFSYCIVDFEESIRRSI